MIKTWEEFQYKDCLYIYKDSHYKGKTKAVPDCSVYIMVILNSNGGKVAGIFTWSMAYVPKFFYNNRNSQCTDLSSLENPNWKDRLN